MSKLLGIKQLCEFWQAIKAQLNLKVDKVSGKGLSTNDFTTAEKDKLAGIASGAEVNVQSDWNQATTTADDYIKNKPSVYTKTEADNRYVNATGDTMTGGLTLQYGNPYYDIKATGVNAKAANNGSSSTQRTGYRIYDNNGLLIGQFITFASSGGNITTEMMAYNYNTSGTLLGTNYIQCTVNKSGAMSYAVANMTAFKQGIAVYADEQTQTLTALGKDWYFTKRNGIVFLDAYRDATSAVVGMNTIGTLSAGLRPKYLQRIATGNNPSQVFLQIEPDGVVKMYSPTAHSSAFNNSFSHAYIAA